MTLKKHNIGADKKEKNMQTLQLTITSIYLARGILFKWSVV